MERDEICRVIQKKIEKIRDIKVEVLDEKWKEEFLTGAYWNLSAEHMVYLYYEICDYFQIQIEVEELENYRFATVNGIADIVAGTLAAGCH